MSGVSTSMLAPMAGFAITTLVAGTLLSASAGANDASRPWSAEAGRQLILDNGCNGPCHARRLRGGDPGELFTRTIRQVNSREELRRKVEACVSQLATMIFPDDIDDVIEALDADFYRFGDERREDGGREP